VAGRETLRRLLQPKIYLQGRCVVSESDVEDGELPPRLVDYPPAGHHPDLADVWCWRKGPGRLPAYRMAVLTQGHSQVVIVDNGPGVRRGYRVHRD
jgi:hypothetical protein